MTDEQQLEAFGNYDPSTYEAEVPNGGATPPESSESIREPRRTLLIIGNASSPSLTILGIVRIAHGTQRQSEIRCEAAALVDTHRDHISKWYDDCSDEIHAGLGSMYVADERFRSNINTPAVASRGTCPRPLRADTSSSRVSLVGTMARHTMEDHHDRRTSALP